MVRRCASVQKKVPWCPLHIHGLLIFFKSLSSNGFILYILLVVTIRSRQTGGPHSWDCVFHYTDVIRKHLAHVSTSSASPGSSFTNIKNVAGMRKSMGGCVRCCTKLKVAIVHTFILNNFSFSTDSSGFLRSCSWLVPSLNKHLQILEDLCRNLHKTQKIFLYWRNILNRGHLPANYTY